MTAWPVNSAAGSRYGNYGPPQLMNTCRCRHRGFGGADFLRLLAVAVHLERSGARTIDSVVLSLLSPAYDGSIEVGTLPADWTERVGRRVETGLLMPGSRRRANYVVRSKSADFVSFAADDFWTVYNVGLNDVELRRADGGHIAYHGSFTRWAAYAAIQGLGIVSAVLIAVLLIPGARAEVASYGGWGWPVLISLLVFFGLVWPRFTE